MVLHVTLAHMYCCGGEPLSCKSLIYAWVSATATVAAADYTYILAWPTTYTFMGVAHRQPHVWPSFALWE